MSKQNSHTIRQLSPDDTVEFRELLNVFGRAFEEMDTYTADQPGDDYLTGLLGTDDFIALIASHGGAVVGGLTAYELKKFERERSEIYIYDLAVAEEYRRQGIATALIGHMKAVARAHGAYVLIIQADKGDEPAVALYSRLGTREDVLHFDIDPG